jgi:hypothetical protein
VWSDFLFQDFVGLGEITGQRKASSKAMEIKKAEGFETVLWGSSKGSSGMCTNFQGNF